MIYEKARAEQILFDNSDVITTSEINGGESVEAMSLSAVNDCPLGLFGNTGGSCPFNWITS